MVNDAEIASFPDRVDINYVEDVNWDDILKKNYDLNEVIKRNIGSSVILYF